MNTKLHQLEEENKKMRETLEYANYNLGRIWHELRKGKELDMQTEIGVIGTAIENTLNELQPK